VEVKNDITYMLFIVILVRLFKGNYGYEVEILDVCFYQIHCFASVVSSAIFGLILFFMFELSKGSSFVRIDCICDCLLPYVGLLVMMYEVGLFVDNTGITHHLVLVASGLVALA
jgi:hypothetical protein